MAGKGVDRPIAEGDRGFDIFLFPHRKHGPPDQSSDGRQIGQRQGQHHAIFVRADHHHQRQGKQDTGKGHQRFDDHHHQAVERPLNEAAKRADHHTAGRGQQYRQHTDGDRYAGPRQDAGKLVPAKHVGAKKVFRRCRREAQHEVRAFRIVGCVDHTGQRGQKHKADHRAANQAIGARKQRFQSSHCKRTLGSSAA